MKKNYVFLILFLIAAITFSQTNLPSGFNVQFAVRRANGSAFDTKPVLVKAKMFDGATLIYENQFSAISNKAGIVSIQIKGDGSIYAFPSAIKFASNNLSLSIDADTTNSGNSFLNIYSQQLFLAVPYAITAQKAPGTFEYQYDDSEAGDPTKGITKDALFQNDTNDANFFPRLFFNKRNNIWSATENSYSLLPNKLANVNRTIFFDITANPNLKPRWVINQALTMNNSGLGINIPSGASPSKALEVFGNIRFASLNATGTNQMLVINSNGELLSQTIPSGSGPTLPLGVNQGDMLFYDLNGSNNWASTSNISYRSNSFFSASNITAGDSLIGKNGQMSNTSIINNLFLNSLKNNSPLDTLKFLSTNVNGRVILRRATNFVWGLKGNDLSLIPGQYFLGTTDTSDLILKTNGNEVMRFFGNNKFSFKAGDIRIPSSVNIAKNTFVKDSLFTANLVVSSNVNYSSTALKNLNLVDSTNFLTTDNNGNVLLRQVKFPSSGGGNSKWTFVQNNNYITPIVVNKGLLIATTDSFATARIINKTTAGSMEVLGGEIFQSKYAPTLLVTNRSKPLFGTIFPIGVKVETEDSTYAIGLNANGGLLFTNTVIAGVGVRGQAAIGVQGIGKSRALLEPSIGGFMLSGISVPGRINLLGAGLVVEGLDGASGLIVKSGNSGFGIKYTGQAFSPLPNSTVDINGTFGQAAKYYNFNGVGVISIPAPDTSNIYVVAVSSITAINFSIPLPENFPNREYTFYLNKTGGNYGFSLSTSAISRFQDFKTLNPFTTFPFNQNKAVKVKAVSTAIGANYRWVVTVEALE